MERNIVDKIRHEFQQRGIWQVKIHGSSMQVAGIPDLLCCWNGRFVGLEVKEPGEQATPLQRYTLSEIEKAGGVVGVVHSLSEALAVLDRAENEGMPCVRLGQSTSST